ncbi:MAG: hypothetical protein QG608_1999 [Actinomycetota bacterium]|nr:hypothetical protein [Actinomycetota bacterium]
MTAGRWPGVFFTVAVAVASVTACSSSIDTSSTDGTPTASSPVSEDPGGSGPSDRPTALPVPSPLAGEVSRVVYVRGEVVGDHRIRPRPDTAYLVRGACLAGSTNKSLGYEITEVRSPGKFLSGGEILCDGSVTVNSAFSSSGAPVPVDVRITGDLAGVVTSYLVVVPE